MLVISAGRLRSTRTLLSVVRFLRTVSCAIVVAATLLLVSVARADSPVELAVARVTAATGARGPVALRQTSEGFGGAIAVHNDGPAPLVVSRVAVRGDARDPRSPPKVVVRPPAPLPLTIAPGASAEIAVQWIPDRGGRLRQLFGHVVVTTDRGAESAIGIRAQIPGLLGALESRVISLLVGAPLLGALVIIMARAAGRRGERLSHGIALASLALQAALALYVFRGFASGVARADGNDGLQFVERAVWVPGLAIELFFGVDGLSSTAIFVASLVALFALLPERKAPRGTSGYHSAYLVVAAAGPGALAAMDGFVLVLFSGVAVFGSALLVGAWGGEARRAASLRLVLLGGFAVLLLLLAILTAGRHADPTLLVDGTRTTTTLSLPELSRMAALPRDSVFLGGALVKIVFTMTLVASLALLGAFPLHGWLVAVLREAPAGPAALVVTTLPAIGATVLLRVGFGVFPEGTRWIAGVIVALGAVSACYGAFAALGADGLRALAGWSTTMQAGFVLLGAGSLTPQGLSAAMALPSARGVACALFLLVAHALERRGAASAEVARGDSASWTAALGLASVAQVGVAGVGAAWCVMTALLGAVPNYGPLVAAAAVALALAGAAHALMIARIARTARVARTAGRLRLPVHEAPAFVNDSADSVNAPVRDWATVGPLVVVLIGFALFPGALFGPTIGTARDLGDALSPPGPDQIATIRPHLRVG